MSRCRPCTSIDVPRGAGRRRSIYGINLQAPGQRLGPMSPQTLGIGRTASSARGATTSPCDRGHGRCCILSNSHRQVWRCGHYPDHRSHACYSCFLRFSGGKQATGTDMARMAREKHRYFMPLWLQMRLMKNRAAIHDNRELSGGYPMLAALIEGGNDRPDNQTGSGRMPRCGDRRAIFRGPWRAGSAGNSNDLTMVVNWM